MHPLKANKIQVFNESERNGVIKYLKIVVNWKKRETVSIKLRVATSKFNSKIKRPIEYFA